MSTRNAEHETRGSFRRGDSTRDFGKVIPRNDCEIEAESDEPEMETETDSLDLETPPDDPEMASPPDDGDPHELLDLIEAAVDQVLEIAPDARSVSEYPSVARPGHRTLTPGQKLMVLHPKVMRLSKGIEKLKAELSKWERLILDQRREIDRLRNGLHFEPPALSVRISKRILVECEVVAALNELINDPARRRR
jgi:hypothetical protein